MADPVVLMPDAVAVLTSHLRTVLASPVHARIPADRPASFLLVQRTGGPRTDIVRDAAQVTLEAFGTTEKEAHDLIQLARAHVHALRGTAVGGTSVYAVREFAGPGNLPDPVSESPRYSMTFQVSLRGAPLTP